jgi:hypothetical protein
MEPQIIFMVILVIALIAFMVMAIVYYRKYTKKTDPLATIKIPDAPLFTGVLSPDGLRIVWGGTSSFCNE